MKRLRWLAIPACLALMSAISPSLPTAAAATAPHGGAARSVTLITGDAVDVRGDGVISVRPGKGRERVGFLRQRDGGHDLVIPGDAVALLTAGRLDRRLFDVTGLLAAGYDDARRDTIPLVVRYGDAAARAGTRDWVRRHGAQVTGELTAVGALSARTAKKDAGAWWSQLLGAGAGDVESVWLDGRLTVSLGQSTARIGAPAAWQAGLTGRGVTVAVLDTGVDAGHPDLAGRIRENRNFTEVAEGGDVIGHGTHVASTIAGTGAASDGRYRGVASDADLLIGKVCEDRSCPESAMLAGMQWAAERGADVVNISISGRDTEGVDLLEEAINRLSERYGTLFVVAAGNGGYGGASTVGSPSTAEAALSVAATTLDDEVPAFSGRGPRLGDGGNKPEIAAPGVDIVAARSSQAPPERFDPVGDRYARMSGTSMATPHVAGAAALLAQRYPDWTGARLKAALVATATPKSTVEAQGAGRVDLGTALAASVVPETGSLNLGAQQWPHEDDAPVTRTVTYRNHGSAPLTLDVAATLAGPDGAPAPDGMISVDPRQISVPAGGTAAVTVTVDTSVQAPDGRYAGRVTATAASGAPVATLLSVVRDIERYALTVRVLDRHGAETADYVSMVTSWADHTTVTEWTPGGYTLRLPAGDYTVGALVFTDTYQENETITLLAQPKLSLTRDSSLVFDARAGQPITATVPEPTASFTHANIGYLIDAPYPTEDAVLNWENTRRGFDNMFTAQVGPSTTGDTFRSDISAGWGLAGADGDYADTPYAYHLGWVTPGGLPTGLTRHIRPADLATVTSTYHGPAGGHGAAGSAPSNTSGFVIAPSLNVPGRRTDHYYGSDSVRWFRVFFGSDADLYHLAVDYRPGRTYRESWNSAVLSPAFGDQLADSLQGIRRLPEGQIFVNDGLLTDPVPGRASGGAPAGRTALYRDGELLAEEAVYGWLRAGVPPQEATYRLEASRDRSSSAVVSTKVSVAWTFRSRHEVTTRPVALPLLGIRYAPALDAGLTAPAGRPYSIPIRVEHQAGSTGRTVTGLTVQVSYDDGATWSPAPVTRSGGNWTAAVTHPAGAGHVSLRATATDSRGGRVEQTIIRAYLLR